MTPIRPPEPARRCVLVLLQTSPSMHGRARGGRSPLARAVDLVNHLFARFAQREEEPGETRFDVGVLGYGTGNPEVPYTSLLPTVPTPEPPRYWPLLPLAELRYVLRGRPFTVEVQLQGSTSFQKVLAPAAYKLNPWMRDHPGSLPLIVHCTDGESDDIPQSKILEAYAESGHKVHQPVVITCGFDETKCRAAFPAGVDEFTDLRWRDLWAVSLPIKEDGRRRALCLNADPEQTARTIAAWIRQGKKAAHLAEDRSEPIPRSAAKGPVARQEPGQSAPQGDNAPCCQVQALVAPRHGNHAEECEDAHYFDKSRGLVALADGAGGDCIFVRAWAQSLVRHVVTEGFPSNDPDAVAGLVESCRPGWEAAIHSRPQPITPFQQSKLTRYGAAATLLALEVKPAGAGRFCWRAWAVGDTCLIRVREGKRKDTLPPLHSSLFGAAPPLLRTVQASETPKAVVSGSTTWKKTSWLLLATDAVAKYLLRCWEQQRPPDLERFWAMNDQDWRAEVEQLRDRGELENDDSTLLLVRPT